jgi:glycosyltransferase involved in cell wall biosynthesis
MNKKLSILICSLSSRADKLQRLMTVLEPQLNEHTELLIKTDNGEIPIGKKRNILLDESTGDYVAFVDDDDLVSDDYVRKILDAIQTNPDCCGMQGVITFQGRNPRMFIHSLKYKEWFEKNNVYYRCPNHLNPVKRSIALQVKFPETNFGEDRDFSTRLYPLLKEERFISGVIYHYLYEKAGPANTNNTNVPISNIPRASRPYPRGFR